MASFTIEAATPWLRQQFLQRQMHQQLQLQQHDGTHLHAFPPRRPGRIGPTAFGPGSHTWCPGSSSSGEDQNSPRNPREKMRSFMNKHVFFMKCCGKVLSSIYILLPAPAPSPLHSSLFPYSRRCLKIHPYSWLSVRLCHSRWGDGNDYRGVPAVSNCLFDGRSAFAFIP